MLHCAVLCSGPPHCAEGGNFPLSSLEEGPGVLKKYLEMFLPFQSSCPHQGSNVDPPPPVEPRRGLGGMLEAEWGTRRFEMFSLSAQVPQSRQGFGHPMLCFLSPYTLPTALAWVKWTAVESRQYGQGKNLVSFEEALSSIW